MPKKTEAIYKYIGEGKWLFRIPMRDLTQGDVDRLTKIGISEKYLVGSKLYKKVRLQIPKKDKEV